MELDPVWTHLGMSFSGKHGCIWSLLALHLATVCLYSSQSFEVPCWLILYPHHDLNHSNHTIVLGLKFNEEGM